MNEGQFISSNSSADKKLYSQFESLRYVSTHVMRAFYKPSVLVVNMLELVKSTYGVSPADLLKKEDLIEFENDLSKGIVRLYHIQMINTKLLEYRPPVELGLLWAQSGIPTKLGLIGDYILTSPSARIAMLNGINIYEYLRYCPFPFQVLDRSDKFVFSLPLKAHLSELNKVVDEVFAISHILASLEDMDIALDTGIEVGFTHSQHHHMGYLGEKTGVLSRVSLNFDTDELSVAIPGRILDTKLHTANKEHNRTLKTEINSVLYDLSKGQEPTLMEKVIKYIFDESLSAISVGSCFQQIGRLNHLTLEGAARDLALSPKSLSRKLSENYSITFKSLTFVLRMTLAASLLVATKHSVERIAKLAGYNDRSNFIRAFRKCFSQSPNSYRLSNAHYFLDDLT